jgi:hypothetical protein
MISQPDLAPPLRPAPLKPQDVDRVMSAMRPAGR